MGIRLIFAGLGLILLISLSSMKTEAAAADPTVYITDLGNRVLDLFRDSNGAERDRAQRFRQLADDSFDIPKISRFILGRYWTTASDAERQQFLSAFEDYMVQVYWSYFNQYHAQGITVLAQRDLGSSSVRISSQIIRPNGQQPVKVDWTIAPQGDSYKIIDVSIEGVSQALAYRDEFGSIIMKNGGHISAVTDELRRKTGS